MNDVTLLEKPKLIRYSAPVKPEDVEIARKISDTNVTERTSHESVPDKPEKIERQISDNDKSEIQSHANVIFRPAVGEVTCNCSFNFFRLRHNRETK